MKVSEIAKQINKAWKNDVITSADMIPEIEKFSMGTLSANYALYGGLPEGKLVVYAGESGSCKSLLACLAMAQYQKKHPDRTCIYVDAEETLRGQIEWIVKMTGLDLDPEKFMRYDCSGKSAEEIFDDIVQLEKSDNIGLIVVDSAPMLLSQADIDNDIAKDNGQRASIAKSVGKFCRFMIPLLARQENTLIIINHTRIAGKTHTGANIYTEPCGYALNFYPTVKVRFASRKFTNGDKLDLSQSQSNDADGICATFSVTKNRLGALNRNGAKIIFRYETGLDTLTDLIEIITKYEIAKRLSSMSWQLVDPITGEIYVDEETGEELKFTGNQKMIDYIRDHDEFRAIYEQVVSDYINANKKDISLIDEDDLKQILEAEKGVEETIKNGGIDEDEEEYSENSTKNEKTSNNKEVVNSSK